MTPWGDAELPDIVHLISVFAHRRVMAVEVPVLVVHVRGSKLCPSLIGKQLKVRVKYGCPRRSACGDTLPVRLAAEAFSTMQRATTGLGYCHRELVGTDFGSTCLFLRRRERGQRIRLRLLTPGLFSEKLLASGETTITNNGGLVAVPLTDTSGKVAGTIEIATEKVFMNLEELLEAAVLLKARPQKQALVSLLPMAQGCIFGVDGNPM